MNNPTLRTQTKGELEAEIARALIHFEKEYMGRGPLETHAHLIDDMVLVRLRGVLTPAEHRLAESREHRGRYLVKQMRQEVLERGRSLLDGILREILDVGIKSIHTDISTRTGERIIVFTLERRPLVGPPTSSGRPNPPIPGSPAVRRRNGLTTVCHAGKL